MQFSFFEESIRLLFLNCHKNPEKFVGIFDKSPCLIGFNYCCTENKFTHVSASFKKVLGYDPENITCNGNFSSKIVHPHDQQLLNEYFKTHPVRQHDIPLNEDICKFKRTKCRVKHIKGYWKYLVIFSMNHKNPATGHFNKTGILADEHMQQYLEIDPVNWDGLPITTVNTQNKMTFRDSSKNSVTVSPREAQILEMISSGAVAKDIAQKLHISLNTVITHRKNLLSKLNVRNTAEMIKKAVKSMLI